MALIIFACAFVCVCVSQVLEWGVNKSPEEVISKRDAMIAQLEQANNTQRKTQACENWFNGCDPLVRKVTKDVNGALFQQLLVATDYHDVDCVNLFRRGGQNGWAIAPERSRGADAKERYGGVAIDK